MANRQLLRLKQRSNGDVLQVAESDDTNNLYVNVAASTPIDIDGGTIDEVTQANMYGLTVDGMEAYNVPIQVTSFGKLLVEEVDLIDEVAISKSYGINDNGEQKQLRTSLVGYTLQKPVQSSVQYSDDVPLVWANSSAQYTGKTYEFELPSGDISESYFVSVYNPSTVTDLSMYVMNEIVIGGNKKYGAIYDKSNTAAAITVPKSSAALFSGTAWNSCFTSIGGVLVDESGDINDAAGGNDVPFAFGAQNDAIYFGAPMEFDRIRVNVSTAGVYVATTVWEYWNGSAWSALTEVVDTTNATTQDGSASFKRTGIREISFYPPSDWVAYDIPSDPVSAFWIRCRISAFTSRASGPSLQQGWYKSVGVPEVHSYLIKGVYGGDACRITMQNATALGTNDGFTAYVQIKRL